MTTASSSPLERLLALLDLECVGEDAFRGYSPPTAGPMVFGGQAIPLRLSYGVRAFEPGLEAAQMLAEADAAMFLRKGRR